MTRPRLFGIPAADAPVVAVLRRGPTRWCQVGRWDVERGAYQPGSWLHGTLYPQRCDLSPDGRWLCYFTSNQGARWAAGETYVAISRLPWLRALAAWATCGTWSRGFHFVDSRRVWEVGEPTEGDVRPCRKRYGLAYTRTSAFAVERRHGWTEAPGSPPYDEKADFWESRRAATLQLVKPRPGADGAVELRVRGWLAAFRSAVPGWPREIRYELVENGRVRPLDDVQWADWDGAGRLLVATRAGRIQIRDEGSHVQWETDLAPQAPSPEPPPGEAARW